MAQALRPPGYDAEVIYLVTLLQSRLDSIVWRMGFSRTIPQARQLVEDGYQRLRQALGEPGVTRRAAAAILDALPAAASV